MHILRQVKSAIGWLWAALLCLLYSFLIVTYTRFFPGGYWWVVNAENRAFAAMLLAGIAFLTLVLTLFALLAVLVRHRGVTLILCIVSGAMVVSYTVFAVSFRESSTAQTFFQEIPLLNRGSALLILSLACCVLFWIILRRYGMDALGRGRTVLALLLTLPLVYLAWDAPPVKNDYTWNDIRIDLPEAKKSAEDFLRLHHQEKRTGLNLGMYVTMALMTNAVEHATQIENAWAAMADARKIIEELKAYAGIGDPNTVFASDAEREIWVMGDDINALYGAYRWYIALKLEEGKPVDDALKSMATFHAVVRKAIPYATSYHTRSWLALALRYDIETAFYAVAARPCSSELLHELGQAFVPIPAPDLAYRNTCLREYLYHRQRIEVGWPATRSLEGPVCVVNGKPAWKLGLFGQSVAWLMTPLIYNKNRTLWEMKADADFLLQWADQYRPDRAQYDAYFNGRRRHSPRLKNIMGSEVYMGALAFGRVVGEASDLKVRSDLFAIYLAQAAGAPLELPDYYTGGQYATDAKTGLPFSAGRDGKLGTPDDVRLALN